MPLRHPGLRTLACVLVAAFALGAQAQDGVDVPFITTPDNVTLEMLEAAKVAAGDHVIDLGSGDGRIVITAARRFGATGLGVELVPDLVSRSLANARIAGVADRVEFRVQDLFQTDLSAATVITMYLLPEVNLRLRPELLKLKPGTRIVSHDWDMGDWQPDRTKVVAVPDKKVGLEKSSKVHLWVVPARIGGLWCDANRTALDLSQQYQHVKATLGGRALEGRLDGATLRTAEFVAQAAGDALRVVSASGASATLQGRALTRASGGRC